MVASVAQIGSFGESPLKNDNTTLFHRGLPKSVGIDPRYMQRNHFRSSKSLPQTVIYLATATKKNKKHTLQRHKCWHLVKKQDISLKSPKTTSRWWHLVELLDMYFTWNFSAHLDSGNDKHLFGDDAHIPGRSARPFQQPSILGFSRIDDFRRAPPISATRGMVPLCNEELSAILTSAVVGGKSVILVEASTSCRLCFAFGCFWQDSLKMI